MTSADKEYIKLSKNEIDNLSKSGVEKLHRIENELNEFFVEREEVIKDAMRALIIGQHVFLYGPPGTAKSLLVYELCSRIQNAKYFQWLLNKTSDPAEIIGPYSIKAMEQGKFSRKTDGKLPEAHIAFIDEIWKSNEPTLNILLPLLNEKIFYNDGKPVEVPLITMFCASNELPEEDELNALYDRIIFRDILDYVKDMENRVKMHKNYINKRASKSLNKDEEKSTISLEEIYALQKRAEVIEISEDIYYNFEKLITALSMRGIVISDRRQNECLKVLQGNAVYEGRSKVILEDFESLKYVLWNKVKDVEQIEEEILRIINPFDDKINDYVRKFREIKDHIESIYNRDEKCKASIEGKVAIDTILKKMNMVVKQAKENERSTKDMEDKIAYIKKYSIRLAEQALNIDLSSNEDIF